MGEKTTMTGMAAKFWLLLASGWLLAIVSTSIAVISQRSVALEQIYMLRENQNDHEARIRSVESHLSQIRVDLAWIKKQMKDERQTP